ncbi:unnamed protein product [Ceratitis capitata]|uniref:(Mediterranean fruit fly) hypothetical protein n=1 Tax=Ceratitis capitata TaxID=7213 RepID=A0A811UQ27_CERCA|nr:unnamed protein product [Ceratitis capitata]
MCPMHYAAIRRCDGLITFQAIVSVPPYVTHPTFCSSAVPGAIVEGSQPTSISLTVTTNGYEKSLLKRATHLMDFFNWFTPYGKIINHQVIVDGEGRLRDFGYVTFLALKWLGRKGFET